MDGVYFPPPLPLTSDLANQHEPSPDPREEVDPQQPHWPQSLPIDEQVAFGYTRMEESRLSTAAVSVLTSAVSVGVSSVSHNSNPTEISNIYFELINQKMLKSDSSYSYYSNTPQFMILNNQLDKFKDFIYCTNEPFSSDEDELNARVNFDGFLFDLKPLHIAAMMNNVAAVKILLSTKLCQVNALDGAGATALFHAAINGNLEIANLLMENGASKECMKEVEYSTLLAQCHPPLNAPSQQTFFREGDQIVRRTGDDFNRLVGSRLIDQDLYICPQEWIEKWKNIQDSDHYEDNRARWYAKRELSTYHLSMRSFYENFCKSTPKRTYLDFDPAIGYYLRAGEDIPPFTVIGEYLGEVNDALYEEKNQALTESLKRTEEGEYDEDEKKFLYSDQSKYHYQLGGRNEVFWDLTPYGGIEWKTKQIEVIDAHAYRSLMAMVNCSFPNVMARPVLTPYNMIRILFITMEAVPEGDPFAYDYGGDHGVKKMRYREMREEALESFVKSTDLEVFASKLPQNEDDYSDDLQERLKQVSEEAKFDYLLKTPTAILSLTIKGLLSFTVIDKLFRSKFQIRNRERDYRSTMVGTFMWELKKLIEYDMLTEPRKIELLNAIGKQELLIIYRMLKSMNQEDGHS